MHIHKNIKRACQTQTKANEVYYAVRFMFLKITKGGFEVGLEHGCGSMLLIVCSTLSVANGSEFAVSLQSA
jgi:hypothetical protein